MLIHQNESLQFYNYLLTPLSLKSLYYTHKQLRQLPMAMKNNVYDFHWLVQLPMVIMMNGGHKMSKKILKFLQLTTWS